MKSSATATNPGQFPPVASQLAARGRYRSIDDRHHYPDHGGPFVVARKERLKSSTRVIGNSPSVPSSDDGAITSLPSRMASAEFLFSMLGHAPVTARASRCEKTAAFAGEHRKPLDLKEPWRLSRRARSVLAKILAVRREGDSPR
jgi:hypothetical protein